MSNIFNLATTLLVKFSNCDAMVYSVISMMVLSCFGFIKRLSGS